VRANFPNSKRNSQTLVREPRAPLSAAQRAERLKLQEQEARLAWQEYHERQRAIEANTVRLRALRLARAAKS
jgi:hypothetical protein